MIKKIIIEKVCVFVQLFELIPRPQGFQDA